MNYSKVNNVVGWLCFFIATITYILTLEPSASFWDCGEFIASAYKMQVVHQPGAPLFLMIQRFFSIFAGSDVTKIAYWMNIGSAVSSGATILFLFWTVTAFAKKIVVKADNNLSTAGLITIMGAGAVGALAYTFSDSFWFSAVESEVYAQSSLFTAIVFWAIMKWESHADEPKADRWLLFIAYIMGLSIGIHLLNLLTIPAIAFVYYFKRTSKPTTSGIFKTLLVGILILGIIQYGIIQYLVSFGASFDLFFVNTLGMGFGSGVIFFALLLIGALVFGIRYSIQHHKKTLNLALISTVLIIFGYASFAMIIIRAKAEPNLNNSAPKDAFSFLSYLNREQYGDRPLLFGPNYNSERIGMTEGKTLYRKGENKYEVAGKKNDYEYSNNTLLPRMYSDEQSHADFYKEWMHLDDTKKPNLIDNVGFLASYQIGYMYMRYFMWNFAGRQNDVQGQGSGYEGEWLSGIKPLDALRLGNQKNLPPSTIDNKAYNRFYFLPLILGLIGAVYMFQRSSKDAGIITLLFFFTGIAIVLYLNQKPLEPRERDYAYVGSFYAYCIFIGLSVIALKDWLLNKLSPTVGATLATVIGLFAAPVIMASQGWDDHDRSTKLVAHDIAYDYLQSCAPNAIIFTYGDNDTYPLWYIQEVENVRPDIRIVNLSLFDTDWYINGARQKQNESAPLPITMQPNQYVQGVRDVMPFDQRLNGSVELKDIVGVLLSDNDDDKVAMQDGTKSNFLPTKDFKLTINPQDVINTGTVPAADADKIAPVMEWKFNKGYVTKGTLAMLDILAHNDWKRPIYFASTVPSSQYNGLDNYLYSEGLAMRLLPLKVDTVNKPNRDELQNTPVLYKNLMEKFKWGNMKTAKYLDPQSSDDTFIFTNLFNSLSTSLIKEGKIEDAKKVVAKYFEVMPQNFYGIRTVLGKYYMAENLYKLGQADKANAILSESADYIQKELNYLADISESKKSLTGMQNIQTGLYFLNQMVETSKVVNQPKLTAKLETIFAGLEGRFSPYFSQQ
jgi:hypothetical protein